MSSSTSTPESPNSTLSTENEPERVRQWREYQLIRAGYSLREADLLASDEDVDLHEAVDLVQLKGCPAYIAVRILLQ
jgi:hypothetical protein